VAGFSVVVHHLRTFGRSNHEKDHLMLLGLQPRFRLAQLPTPLLDAPRLRTALGGDERCPRILIKRDDLTGLAFGGNKVRKLEFLIAEALALGATTIVTAGAVQSNHARATAAAAAVAGLKCALVLDAKVAEPPVQGNLLLDQLLGAEVHIVPSGSDMDAEMGRVANGLADAGERPYVVPIGGSNAVGTLGYVAATLELLQQCFELGVAPDSLHYANGSRGTQAGLVLGAAIFGAPWVAQGIAVSGGDDVKRAKAVRIANEAAERLGVEVRLSEADMHNDDGHIGEGYGILTPGCVEAINLLARTEGIFLDPVYSGKAMAGLIDHIRTGAIGPSETTIFLHTGGTPALFAFQASSYEL
jgi:D-cysteine desulfhydrase family pyridoxal phosphate-dependent enzyme